MSGLEDDPRRFVGPFPRVITKDINTKVEKAKRCYWCKMVITGKVWRVDSKRVECTRCHNETPSSEGDDFFDYDFHVEDFG